MGIVTLWHRKMSWSAVASKTSLSAKNNRLRNFFVVALLHCMNCMFFVFRFLFGLDGYLRLHLAPFFKLWAQGKEAMEAKVWPHDGHISQGISHMASLASIRLLHISSSHIFSSYEERLKIRQSLHDFDWFRNFVINHCILQRNLLTSKLCIRIAIIKWWIKW